VAEKAKTVERIDSEDDNDEAESDSEDGKVLYSLPAST